MRHFEIWHARTQARALQNRSGSLPRKSAPRPVSWGECQDYNASRLVTMSRTEHKILDPIWKCTAEQYRLILDRRAKRSRDPWYDTEYRISYHINTLAFTAEMQAASVIWAARATYETAECNIRGRGFRRKISEGTLISWKTASYRNTRNLATRSTRNGTSAGRQTSGWDLTFRATLLRFSHADDSRYAWFKSVTGRLMRLLKSQQDEEKMFHVNH